MSNGRPVSSYAERADVKGRARAYLKTISKAPLGSASVRYAPPLPKSDVLSIASEILQIPLTEDRAGRFYLRCPGAEMHGGGHNARRDCEFLPDGAPTLRCFHESCSGVIDVLNREIRSACGKAKVRNFTDATARSTKAAEALLIGFDMEPEQAKKLLAEWARGCTPPITSADLSAAFKSAKRSYARAGDSRGCLLDGGTMPASIDSPQPPQGFKSSVVSVAKAPSSAAFGVGAETAVYVGPVAELIAEVKHQIELYYEDHGLRPTKILIGINYLGQPPPVIDGIPTERWQHREHSVVGP